MSLSKDVLKTISLDLTMIKEFDITENIFYDRFSVSLFKKMKDKANNGYKLFSFNNLESGKLEDSTYLLRDNMVGFCKKLKDQTLRYRLFDSLNGAIEKIKNEEITISELANSIGLDISDIQYLNADFSGATKALDYIRRYKEETEEMEKSNKNRFYSFSHPILEKYVMMEKGWSFNLIGATGSGKTIVACILAIDFVKKYKEKLLFVTDENSESNILLYLKCSFLNLKFRDVIKRKVKLDEVVENLSDEKRKEYEEVFGLIEVWELVGLPIHQIRAKAMNEKIPYGMILLDSFDEIESMSGMENVQRYEMNGKLVESLAKELGVLLGVTAQLDTKMYTISAEKMTQLCNFQAKSLVKKCFFSLLIHNVYDKEGNTVDNVIKINKSRSGGGGIIYAIDKNFDYMQLEPEHTEYDLERIRNKKMENLPEDF